MFKKYYLNVGYMKQKAEFGIQNTAVCKAIQMYKLVNDDAPDYLKMILFLHLRFIQDY